jgi:GH24 family phage-related lysozyme (muramidase)
MKIKSIVKNIGIIMLMLSLFVGIASAEPIIQASPYIGLQGTLFKFSGSGFTPTGDVAWHVLKPDGTENSVKVLVADSSGNITYQYLSTCKSMAGLYITWAIDMVTGTQHFRNLNWAIAPAPECKGVQLTLTTDKASYNSGENIKFTLTNKYPYKLPMGREFSVLAKDGTVVWGFKTWTDPVNIPATAGNSKSVIEWNQKFPSNISRNAQSNNPKYFDVNHNLVPGEYKGTWGTSVVSLETSLFTIKPPVHKLDDIGLQFIKQWEGGFHSKPYNALSGNVGSCTIGYGHLLHKGLCTPKELKTSITEAQGLQILSNDVQIAVDGVNKYVTVQLSQNQFDAMVSFAFNIGVGCNSCNSGFATSTVLKTLNEQKYGNVPAELNKYVTDKTGKKVQGLVNRRKYEGDLFMTP